MSICDGEMLKAIPYLSWLKFSYHWNSGLLIRNYDISFEIDKIRTSHRLSYAQEGSQWTDFESMVSKKQDYYSYQDWSMDLDHTKEKSEAKQGPRGALAKYDKVVPLYSNKVSKLWH